MPTSGPNATPAGSGASMCSACDGRAGTGGTVRSRSTATHSANTVAAAAAGTSQLALSVRHHGRGASDGAVRAIAASIAWHRAQSEACRSARARLSPANDPSIHAASVSGSTHSGVAPLAASPWSARRSRRSVVTSSSRSFTASPIPHHIERSDSEFLRSIPPRSIGPASSTTHSKQRAIWSRSSPSRSRSRRSTSVRIVRRVFAR